MTFQNSKPLVSVAMITYNHEQFVTQAIESVLSQRTKFPIELVIGDDASSDRTRLYIQALKNKAPEIIRSLFRPTNLGIHRNLEGVLQECLGEFVAFLEGDDYWTSDEKLQLQAEILQSRDSPVGVFHPVAIVDSLGEDTGTVHPWELPTEVWPQELLGECNIIPTPSVMMRRKSLVKVSDSYRSLKMADWPIWVHAGLRGPWLFLPKVMAAYRVHDGGVWNSLSNAARRDSMMELFQVFAAELPRPFSSIARQRLTQMHLAALEEALADNRPADAHRELGEIVRRLPHCQMRDGRRLASALWRAISPRTHHVAKRTLRLIR